MESTPLTPGNGNEHAYPYGQNKYGWDQVASLLGIGTTKAVTASLPGCDVGCGAYPATGEYQLAMGERVIVVIGDGWTLAIDPYNFRDQAVFEVHVQYKGQTVGTFNFAGEEIKQDHIKLEKPIPQNVMDALLEETETRLRGAGLLKEGETLRNLTVEQRMGMMNRLYERVRMSPPKSSVLRGGTGRLLNGLSVLGMGLDAWSMAQELYENDIIREQELEPWY